MGDSILGHGMKAIANSIVYAVAYINCRKGGDDDADVEALESIAFTLRSATDKELDALSDAAERALAEEKSGSRREEFIRIYSMWMEDTIGDDWIGNRRA